MAQAGRVAAILRGMFVVASLIVTGPITVPLAVAFVVYWRKGQYLAAGFCAFGIAAFWLGGTAFVAWVVHLKATGSST